jgi:hypothetical protein
MEQKSIKKFYKKGKVIHTDKTTILNGIHWQLVEKCQKKHQGRRCGGSNYGWQRVLNQLQ